MEPPRGARKNGFTHSSSVVHTSLVGSSLNRPGAPARYNGESKAQKSHMPPAAADLSNSPHKDERVARKEPGMVITNFSAHNPSLTMYFSFTSQNCGPEN